MKFTLRSASSAAILVGLAGALPVSAQEAPAPAPQVDQTAPQAAAPEQQDAERVVVTGSLIAGSAEDAALPVEVYTSEDLEEQGAPTALEFAKDLTISGPTQGEANFQGGSAPGAVSFNLRGIGAGTHGRCPECGRESEVPLFCGGWRRPFPSPWSAPDSWGGRTPTPG